MNALTKTEPNRPSLIATMAAKYSMDPDQFAKTVRSTVMPEKHTNEQFAALMLVAHEYGLNPVIKEIYAFPAKGGGIVPVVSIDGWINLVNSHPACDGFDIEFNDDDNGAPISCTCRMYRKDRGRPVVVTEYLSECVRSTEPWKMKHRMLRHKAVIQAARYAFGFSGIYDEDEGAKIAEMRDVTPVDVPAPPPAPTPPALDVPKPSQPEEPDLPEFLDRRVPRPQPEQVEDAHEDGGPDYQQALSDTELQLSGADTLEEIEVIEREYRPLLKGASEDIFTIFDGMIRSARDAVNVTMAG